MVNLLLLRWRGCVQEKGRPGRRELSVVYSQPPDDN